MAHTQRNLLINLGYEVYHRVRVRIAQDNGDKCAYCGTAVIHGSFGGKRLATIDHKIPLSRGGSWKRYNLTCACKGCNDLKANLTAEEFMSLPVYLREATAKGIEVDEYLVKAAEVFYK